MQLRERILAEQEAERTESTGKHLSMGWVMLGVTAVAIILDQLTKIWAVTSLPEDGSAPYSFGFISLRLIRNPGAAFSLGAGSTWVFTIISTLVVIAILWWVAKGNVQSVLLAVVLGLIAGGAIGNLIDRLTQPPGFAQGHVIDFIDYNGFFVGNVADIWIVGGALGLVLYFALHRETPEVTDE